MNSTAKQAWPGTRAGLLESIAVAVALAQAADTDREYDFWEERRADLTAKAGTITESESDAIVELVIAKRRAYGLLG